MSGALPLDPGKGAFSEKVPIQAYTPDVQLSETLKIRNIPVGSKFCADGIDFQAEKGAVSPVKIQ